MLLWLMATQGRWLKIQMQVKGPHWMKQDKNDTVCLLYVKGVSENVRSVIRDLNMRAVLRQISLWGASWQKSRPYWSQQHKGFVHRIPYDYRRVHIGETGRALKLLLVQCKWAVKSADSNNFLYSSACCSNRAWHQLGWSRGYAQRGTVEKKEDGCWTIYSLTWEPT